jgi:hypothetical protein
VTTIINGSSPSITFSDGSAQTSATRPFLNRFINGAMVIAQRGTTFSGLSDDGGQYTLDRWRWSENGTMDGAQSVTQDSSAPTGFNYSLKVQTTTAKAVGTSLSTRIEQAIEGFNTSDLAWGTANAKTVTLSFWVRSSLTGTFGGAFRNSADDRSYPFSYTISVADTWEYKTVTVAGDTTGTWVGATNGTGIRINFSLGAGSNLSGTANIWAAAGYQSVTGAVSVLGTLNATWYVTGCQLEVGSTATSFDYRSIGTELALCQRYFTKYTGDTTGNTGYAIGYQTSTTVSVFSLNFPVTMRSEPTCSLSNVFITDGINYDANVTLLGIDAGFTSGRVIVSTSAVGAQFRPCSVLGNTNTTNFITLSSEL